MHKDGITEAVSIVLAPHFSTFSIKSYNGRIKEEAEKLGNLTITSIESWYDEPKFIQFWNDKSKRGICSNDRRTACKSMFNRFSTFTS